MPPRQSDVLSVRAQVEQRFQPSSLCENPDLPPATSCYVAGMALVVDPFHWLHEDGSLPHENPRLRRQVLRVARLIEYGGPLRSLESRETLIECTRRPNRKPCPGLLWVAKTERNVIHSFCMICKTDDTFVHNWEETEWADGMMEAVPPPSLQRETMN